jgi:Myo-inositol oxygenase
MAFYNEPQWAVVGDTFPVGCDWADSVVYRKETFKNNPDGANPNYKYYPPFQLNTKTRLFLHLT